MSGRVVLGWAKKIVDGYQFVGVDGQYQATTTATPAAAPGAPKPTPAGDEVNLEGVEPISKVHDIVHAQLRKSAGVSTYQAIVSGAILGGDLTGPIADLARSAGRPVEDVREAVEGVMGEYHRAARQVFQANGGRGGDGFKAMLQWAQSNGKQDAVIDAMQELVEANNAGPLARLSRSYSRLNRADFTNAEILGANFGKGIRAYERDGVAWLHIEGRGDMTFAKAVQAGHVKLSGGGR